MHFFLDIEQFLDVGMLLNVAIDSPWQILTDLMLIGQLFEYFQVLTLGNILRSNLWYQRSHTVDVVCKDHAADCLDEYHTKSFLIGNRSHISKANSQHYSCSPIIWPNVLLKPFSIVDTLYSQPIIVRIKLRHHH